MTANEVFDPFVRVRFNNSTSIILDRWYIHFFSDATATKKVKKESQERAGVGIPEHPCCEKTGLCVY